MNKHARKADLYNTRTVLVMFLITLAGLAMAFFSINRLQFTSTLFNQAMFYLLLVGIFLTACPFLILAIRGAHLFKSIEGTSYYCPSCLKRIKEGRGTGLGHSDLTGTLAPGQSMHYENDLKKNHREFVVLMIGLMIPILIFGWLYGAYVKGFSIQTNLEVTLFFMILVVGIIAFVFSRNITPRLVDITPNTIVVELKRGRRKVIPFNKITWLNVIMDVQQLKDLPNARGAIDVGRRGILQLTYWIKRDIALDIREAYRASCGVYPPNGYDTKQSRNN